MTLPSTQNLKTFLWIFFLYVAQQSLLENCSIVTEISDRKNQSLSMTEKIGHYRWPNQWPNLWLNLWLILWPISVWFRDRICDRICDRFCDWIMTDSVTYFVTEYVTESMIKFVIDFFGHWEWSIFSITDSDQCFRSLISVII